MIAWEPASLADRLVASWWSPRDGKSPRRGGHGGIEGRLQYEAPAAAHALELMLTGRLELLADDSRPAGPSQLVRVVGDEPSDPLLRETWHRLAKRRHPDTLDFVIRRIKGHHVERRLWKSGVVVTERGQLPRLDVPTLAVVRASRGNLDAYLTSADDDLDPLPPVERRLGALLAATSTGAVATRDLDAPRAAERLDWLWQLERDGIDGAAWSAVAGAYARVVAPFLG